jgi:hypothetical protein
VRYQPRAFPSIGAVVPGIPSYVTRKALLRLAEDATCRRVWRMGNTVTALEQADGTVCRCMEEWGPVEDLTRAATWWTARGCKAASPGGLVFQVAREWYRKAPRGTHAWAAGWVHGAWEEAQVRGVILGPHRMYDLRRAYRWALTADPLPDRRAMYAAKRWDPDGVGLHAVDVAPWPGAPWPLRDGGRVLVETPTDVVRYGLPVVREWHGGVTWHRTVNTRSFAALLDEIGAKAVHRAFWGLWLASTPVRCDYRSGAVTWLPPYSTDHVRAHLILQRVRRRLAEIQTHYRYVDAVIVDAAHAPPTGDAIGEWREVRRYDDGVHITWPGFYGPVAGPPDKHAGVKGADDAERHSLAESVA